MAHIGSSSIEESFHLAACAAQVAEAVAVAVEYGDDNAIDLSAAMRHISNPHSCHIEAAIIILASMMQSEGRCTMQWRDSIPRLVAFIAGSELE